jgi:hypothetical protein
VGLTAGWATFGEALPPGQAFDGLQIGGLETQTDIKNRWPDGSIKFGIVTANVPAAGSYDLTSAPLQSGAFTPVVPSASVTLSIGGTRYTASLPASPGGDRWMNGPLALEWRRVIAPAAAGTAHRFFRVLFDTRAYADGATRLSVTVENVLNQTGATTTTYDATITINGKTVFSRTSVSHYYLTRWRKTFGVGFKRSTVTPDVRPFNLSKAIPAFNSVVKLDPRVDTIGSNFDILQSGAVEPIMGSHGGRAELAPLPDWTARYLVKKHVAQGQFVMANADLSGSWPIHLREPANGQPAGLGSEHLVSVDQEPNAVLASNGGGIKGSPMPMSEYGSGIPGRGQSPLAPSNAHVPSLAYVPYLLTGDRYYAEEMAFWANHGMLATSGHGTAGLLVGNEVRGFGWVMRNLAEAAAYYPDASPVKAYLAQKVVNNLNWLNTYANSLKVASNPLRIVYAWTPYDRPEGAQYFALWENNYLAYGIDRAIKLGFATGNAYRDAANNLQLRFFTSDPDFPRFEAAPYAMPYGTLNSDNSVTFFTTMAQFKRGAVAAHRDFAGYSGPEARLSLIEARERGRAGAQGALDYLWTYIGNGTAYCSTNGTTNEPYLACRAGFALDSYPSSGTPPSSLPAATLSAAPVSIAAGQSATLRWSTSDATTVMIDHGIGTIAAAGTRTVFPASPTTYTLTASNAAGSVKASATVTVTTAAIPRFSPAAGTYNESVNVTISDATSSAAIYYTCDGSTPTTASRVYTGAIPVTQTTTIKAVAAASNLATSGVASATYTVQPATGTQPISIWSPSAMPSAIATSDTSSVELGLKFTSDVSGLITGVRFYKGPRATGTHTGTLWTSAGTRLATATFTGETAAGWQQVTFATPVTIQPNTVYIVSYHTNVGDYAYTSNAFATVGVNSGPLHALSSPVTGGNGVFRYATSTAFPTSSYQSTNYWVDIVFVPGR